MSYYWFNRKELLEQAARYYKENKEAIKKKAREKYKNLSKEDKTK